MVSFRRKHDSWPPHRNVTLVFVSLVAFGSRGSFRFRHGALPVQSRVPHGCWSLIAGAIGHHSPNAVKLQFLRIWRGQNLIGDIANSACFWSYLSTLPDRGPSCVGTLRRRAADAMILCAIGGADHVPDLGGDSLFDAISEWIPTAYSDTGERISFVQSPIRMPYRHIYEPWAERHARRGVDAIHAITRGHGMDVHDDDTYWDQIAASWGRHLSKILQRNATKGRFASFLGWIPHKTTALGDVDVSSSALRMHHTAYTFPELEHLSLAMMDAKTFPMVEIK